MVCAVCGQWKAATFKRIPGSGSALSVCDACTGSLQRAGEIRLRSGVLVRSLFFHEGPIRSAVHAFKYRGADRLATVLAPQLAEILPSDASAVIPVPRSLLRRVRFGIDPGRALARAVARAADVPVADILRAPMNHRSQLRIRRAAGLRFRVVAPPPARAVLIDDVLTTGATLTAAAAACGGAISRAITLTRSIANGQPVASSRPGPPPRPAGPTG